MTLLSKSLILMLAGAALAGAAEKAPLVAEEEATGSANIYRGGHLYRGVYVIRQGPIYRAGRDRDFRFVVYYSPVRAAELNPQTCLFLTEHERARIALGFDYDRRTEAEEYEADRVAVDLLRNSFSRRDWLVVLADLDRYGRENSRRLETMLLAERLI